jgi:hypothetical protein
VEITLGVEEPHSVPRYSKRSQNQEGEDKDKAGMQNETRMQTDSVAGISK